MQKGAAKAAALASKGKAGEEVSRAAEEDITDQLFSQELEMESSSLTSEKTYVKFAQQVGDVLYEGRTPYNIPAFFAELAKGLNTIDLSAQDMKKIKNNFEVVYNAKVAAEKAANKPSKKGKEKPKIAGGKAIDNSRNNNP